MNFLDWFDPDNREHLEAFMHLSKTGSWPECFLPDNCEMSPTWIFQITMKMALRYCEMVLTLGAKEPIKEKEG